MIADYRYCCCTQEAWLEAESAGAASQLEGILYTEQAWNKATMLVAEDRPAWQCELYPPLAAEKVVNLVESLLDRVKYIPQPGAKERYLSAVVGDTLTATHERISRMLQQADVFRDLTSLTWLPKVRLMS